MIIIPQWNCARHFLKDKKMSVKKHHPTITEQDTLLMTLLYKRFITVRQARMMIGRPPSYPILDTVKQLRKRGYNIISLTVINNHPNPDIS